MRHTNRSLFLLSCCSALVMGHSVLTRAVRDSMLGGAISPDDLPGLTILGVIAALVFTIVATGLLRRVSHLLVARGVFAFAALSECALALDLLPSVWRPDVYFVLTAALNMLSFSMLWLIVAEELPLAQNNRVLGAILGSGTLGGLLAGVLLVRIPFMTNLRAALLFFVLLNGLTLLFLSRFRGSSHVHLDVVDPLSARAVLNGNPKRSAVLAMLSVSVLAAMVATLTDLTFRLETAQRFSTGPELLRSFGLLQGLWCAAALGAQLFLARGGARRVNAQFALTAHPLLTGSVSLLALLHPSFVALAFLRTTEYVTRSSLFRSGSELAYLSLPSMVRRVSRPLIDVTGERLGDALAAAVLQLFIWLNWQYVTRPALLTVSIACLLLWVYCRNLGKVVDRGNRRARDVEPRSMQTTSARVASLLVAFVGLLIPASSLEAAADDEPVPSSRAEQITRERRDKASHLVPYQSPFVNRALLYVSENHLQQKLLGGYRGFQPVLGTLGPGSGFGFGVSYTHPLRDTSWQFRSSVSGSILGYRGAGVSLEKSPTASPLPLGLQLETGYRFSPRKDFYGTGPDSKNDTRTGYALEEGWVGASATFNPTAHWTVRPSVRYWSLNVTQSPSLNGRLPTESLYSESALPGIGTQTAFLKSGVDLAFGEQRPWSTPVSTATIFAGAHYLQDLRGRGYSFYQWEAGAQRSFPFLFDTHAISLRGHIAGSDSVDRNPVPFYLQYELGSQHNLRGYRGRRFYDRNKYDASLEYSFRISEPVRFAVFSDFGNTFGKWRDWSRGGVKQSYGFGLYAPGKNSFPWRVDVGFSDEGTQLWLTFASF